MSGSSPLKVIINPPGIQAGMPGEIVDLHVVVMNQGTQNAIIDIFTDETFQLLTQLPSAAERVALAPQQSIEVSFQVPIPVDALPGTYDYNIVVDAPQHYPADTPIQFPQQIKVLLKEQTLIREYDSTFALQPTSNPIQPLTFQAGIPLPLAITVHNRSRRVDSFRITCPDLDEEWLTIRYPTVGENAGLSLGATRLELNPDITGQIWLEFNPPADVLAGSYSFTLRLHSENSPELVMLDAIYIQVPPVYRLDLRLNTILGQIRRSSGKYQIEMANYGNTLRQVSLSAKTRAEEELCLYIFSVDRVKLLPGKSKSVDLIVRPQKRSKQPLFGAGLFINFQVDVEDLEQLPLDKLPHQTLVWQARPWWQFWLLLLIVLGGLAGLGLLAWILLYPHPPKIENFAPESLKIDEGDDLVLLNWEIHNFPQGGNIKLSTQGPVPKKREWKISNLLGDKDNPEISCNKQNKVLSCRNYKTEVGKGAGKYTFKLELLDRENKGLETQISEEVEVVAKPEPEIKDIKSDKSTYNSGDKIKLSWLIQYPEKLTAIKIVVKTEDGKVASDKTIDRNSLIKDTCKVEPQKTNLICQNFPIDINLSGKYQLELIPVSSSKKVSPTPPQPIKFDILAKQSKIVNFTLNGTDEESRVLREGENITLTWKVDGEENIQVELSTSGTVQKAGTKQIPVTTALQNPIILTVTDKDGKKITKVFSIKVESNPTATPTPPVSDGNPFSTPNSPSPTLPSPGIQPKPNPNSKPKPVEDLTI
jgi:hypothetical protein